MKNQYQALFTPFTIGKTEIKNRIVMCAMGGTNLIEGDQFQPEAAEMFIDRAKGGVGLIIPGIAIITDMWGRGGWLHEARENVMEPLTQMMDEIHAHGSKLFMQIGAGMGRVLAINSPMFPPGMDWVKAMNGPSEGLPNKWLPEKKHRELTVEEIQEIVTNFGKAAKMCQDAGVDGIEVHAVHEGYLLDQFSIAATNWRTDQYGGSLENRLRFTTEIIGEIKRVCGKDYPVSVRYSVASKMKGFNEGALPAEAYEEFGRSLEESPAVAQILEAAGCDVLNADNGSYDSWYWAHPPMYMPTACNMPESMYIKQFVDIPVVCAGRMEDLEKSYPAVSGGSIDGIGLARQLLADSDWANKVQENRTEDIRPCIACHTGCFGLLFGRGTSCALDPAVMNKEKYKLEKADKAKKIAVVGGGIGGMEIARLATLRGHQVTLFEKTQELGGVFIAAAKQEFKKPDQKLIDWYQRQMELLDIDLRMNTEATPQLLKELGADEIILATGATRRELDIPGADLDFVVDPIDLLMGKVDTGQRVVVVGGGLTGCEIAYELAANGKEVSVVEMLDDILQTPNLATPNSSMLRELFVYHDVDVHTAATLEEITPSGVRFTCDGEDHSIAADTVVLSIGYNSGAPMEKELGDTPVHVIGDAENVGNLMDVIWGAYDLALTL